MCICNTLFLLTPVLIVDSLFNIAPVVCVGFAFGLCLLYVVFSVLSFAKKNAVVALLLYLHNTIRPRGHSRHGVLSSSSSMLVE